jgi:hypothetical protein
MTDRSNTLPWRWTATLSGAAIVALLALAALPAAPVDAASTQPLASAPTNWDGVELALMAVERKGNVLTVKWAVTNGGDGRTSVRFGLTAKATSYLVDEENGTKYYVLTDQDGNALASEHDYIDGNTWGVTDNLEPGATARYWAKFPAPPPEVKTLTVLFDQTEPFEEVPITDK